MLKSCDATNKAARKKMNIKNEIWNKKKLIINILTALAHSDKRT